MNISKTPLENCCMFLLQKHVNLELNGKVYKQGKLVLFYQKNFYLTFIMDTAKKKTERIEIPIPFEVELHQEDDLVYFDYRIKTLAKHYPDCEDYMKLYSSKRSSSKFWNTILTIDANLK